MSKKITYQSTRGAGNSGADRLDFEQVLLAGLAPDGGLYVPSHLPHFSGADLVRMSRLRYDELAFEVISPFVGDAIAEHDLRAIITQAYATFSHSAVVPLVQIGHNHHLLELFHGETLAFKDVALQFLGRVMDYVLQRKGEHLTILGATSGDTGSAAIAGCKGRNSMDVVILYPNGRVSDVQRRQMTTITDQNIHCIAINGTFDDCQNIVKALFVDEKLRAQKPLGAVNSINWTRIIAQITYYFYAAFHVGAPTRKIAFSVPTGNFGDIYAGYLAKQMGLPIDRLIIASNNNDILVRCLQSGEYQIRLVEQTLSPSMDIGISSNFERLLSDVHMRNHERDGEKISTLMNELKNTASFNLAPNILARINADFAAVKCDDLATKQTMYDIHKNCGYLLDPHTATGVYATNVCAAQQSQNAGDFQSQNANDFTSYITLATAHPAKFPQAVYDATGVNPPLPAHLSDLHQRTERFEIMDNNIDLVRNYLLNI